MGFVIWECGCGSGKCESVGMRMVVCWSVGIEVCVSGGMGWGVWCPCCCVDWYCTYLPTH